MDQRGEGFGWNWTRATPVRDSNERGSTEVLVSVELGEG
jgi:hypothetical protein